MQWLTAEGFTIEEADVEKLVQSAWARSVSIYIQNHTPNSWGPSDDPCRENSPVDTVPVIIRSLCFVEIAELYFPVLYEVEVSYHDPHDRREENGE